MTKDPVCGMEVDEKKANSKIENDGKTYYFCSETCQSKFKAEPARYAKAPKK